MNIARAKAQLERDFYDAVNRDPSRARMDLECAAMCYLSMHVYEERFEEMPHSDISREIGSNKACWEGAE